MMFAITRGVSPAIDRCELTHIDREPIDFSRACAQHRQYVEALRGLGIQVLALPVEPDLPDSVFVEDAALVLDECAIMTNPGARSRRPELESIEAALTPYRKILHVQAPGTIDGGDILVVGKTVFVGVTTRSNGNAIGQLTVMLEPLGYEVRPVPVTGCLHLKSGVTQVADDTLLLNPDWVSSAYFPGLNFLEVDPAEPGAANAVLVGGAIIFPTAFPGTLKILKSAGITAVTVDADELAKAEGAVTCCSLLFRHDG